MGSLIGYNEYIVRRGLFHFVIQEIKMDTFTTIKIYHNNELVFEKCSWDILGVQCDQITQKLNEKLKAA